LVGHERAGVTEGRLRRGGGRSGERRAREEHAEQTESHPPRHGREGWHIPVTGDPAGAMARATKIPLACFGAWRSLVAHSAGGRAVAGSNPVAPIHNRPDWQDGS